MDIRIEEMIKIIVAEFNDGMNINFVGQSPLLEIWKEWYQGNVANFHDYKIWTGTEYVAQKRLSMNMANKICEDWANLLFNEKCDVVVAKGDNQKKIEEFFDKIAFWRKGTFSIQESFALSIGAFVEGIDGLDVVQDEETKQVSVVNNHKGTLTLRYVNADKIYPLIAEDGKITDIAFIRKDTLQTNVSIHLIDRRSESKTKGNYYIVNLIIKNSKGADVIERTDIDTMDKIAWFQLIHPNVSNNIDVDSPLPISIYANAVDSLRAIDVAFDSLNTELQFGRRKIFVSEKLIDIDSNGNTIKRFDPNDTVFYTMPPQDGQPLLQDEAPALRVQDIQAALNEQLNILTSKVGMGENFYNYEVGKRIQTATQVISENSQMFRTIKKHEILLEDMLKDLVVAIATISNNFTEEKYVPITKSDVAVKFDDSIIEDKATEKNLDKADLTSGQMSNVEYRMKWFGEDEEKATNKVGYLDVCSMFDRCSSALSSGQMTPSAFVELVNKALPFYNTDGMEESIADNLNASVQVDNPFQVITGDSEQEQQQVEEEQE